MRPTWAAALAAACLLAAGCSGQSGMGSGPTGSSAAACAAPNVDTGLDRAQPGAELTVRGEFYLDACNDTGPARKAGVLTDLPVRFEQDGEVTDFGRVDASQPDGAFVTTLTVPAGARPGLATVTVGPGEPALVLIGDGQGGFPPWPGPPAGPFELSVDLKAVPDHPEGGWVLATATTIQEGVPEADRQATATVPLGTGTVSFGPLVPSYWTVGVRVHLCETAGCPAPARETLGQACEMEARTIDGPVRMTYTHQGGGGAGGCDLRSSG